MMKRAGLRPPPALGCTRQRHRYLLST